MKAIDFLESENDDRPEGLEPGALAVLHSLEAEIATTQAESSADREWLLTRLARAEANQWTTEAKAPLVEALALAYESEFAD